MSFHTVCVSCGEALGRWGKGASLSASDPAADLLLAETDMLLSWSGSSVSLSIAPLSAEELSSSSLLGDLLRLTPWLEMALVFPPVVLIAWNRSLSSHE